MPLALALALLAIAPCRPAETAVVIDTAARRMTLCDRGRAHRRFPVALGVGGGGGGKRRAGDGRTPRGAYPLGRPRPSRSFGTFVPVGYPTPAQVRLGFTGNTIGIHGPPRGTDAAGDRPLTDWTAGCIAVGSDAEIEAVAAWVRRRRVTAVRLE